ncbi:MAG: hypothetical protein KDB02_06190 [Acidimicrobiales bacterium]|nr:hypothetical protein [Acidimicrobiales bacterium]
MFRRSRPRTALVDPPAAPEGAATAGLVPELIADGWVLPRMFRVGGAPSWTLVGTVASPVATPVDGAGLVVGEGWSLDWWVGADDRWHVPAREASLRQQLLDRAPVVETLLRIPGGDAVHRAYGIRSPRDVGDEWVVAEVHNATAIPFAVALVIRPMVADGPGSVSEITVEPVDGASGRDQAQLVRVDGRPAVVLPRTAARYAAGNKNDGDVLDVVVSGRAGNEALSASCPDGLATLAMVFPLTHTSTLRALIPVGPVGDTLDYPSVVPDAETVASGWSVHRRGPRIDVPEKRILDGFESARAHLQLAHDGEVVRRDGHRARTMEPGATELVLGALDVLDMPLEVAGVVARWPDVLGTDPAPEVDAVLLTVISRHWLLHRVEEMLDWVLPEFAAAVERIDRADRRGRIATAASRRRVTDGLRAASKALAAAGQPEAATRVDVLAGRVGRDLPDPKPVTAADRLDVAAGLAAAGDPAGIATIREQLVAASTTGTWAGPGAAGGSVARLVGDDLAAQGALVLAIRNLLITEGPNGIAVVPHHPDDWYGGGIEVHDAPTSFGPLSFAIRWHGTRPAILWQLDARPGSGPVTLTAPGLDPTWRTTEPRGDALLAEVGPPAGVERVSMVVEHPDIAPEMRRPGSEPEAPTGPMPGGGGFS